MKNKLFCFSSAFLLATGFGFSQSLPLGSWKDYLSYQQGVSVSLGAGKAFCCTSSGVFSYNPGDNSIERYNKVTGLSDIGCTVARYNTNTNTLLVGYSDGNIDLVANNQVTNIPDLKNSLVQGSKTINNVYFLKNIAYVACGQGIIEIDLTQGIILNEYLIGSFGSALNVLSVCISNTDTIFAATVKGIYKASLFDGNLNDYQDWTQIPDTILPTGTYSALVNCGTKMYAVFSNSTAADTIYVYNSGKWSVYPYILGDKIVSLESLNTKDSSYLIYADNYSVAVYDANGYRSLFISNYGFASSVNAADATLDNSGNVWIADRFFGLVESSKNNSGQNYLPPGPFYNSIFDMAVSGSNIYLAPGGYHSDESPLGWTNLGISAYHGDSWYRLTDYPPIPPGPTDSIYDLCCVAVDPKNPLHACAGSWGDGLVEYNDTGIINVYGGVPSTLENLYPYIYGYIVRVGGVGFDSTGNLWASNSSVPSDYISVRKPNGLWKSFNFGGIAPSDQIATKLLVTQTGAKWVLFPGVGILAFQDNGTYTDPTPSNSVFITDAKRHGGLPSLVIYCMVQDLNGAIWIGTNTQVVVFYSPDNVFDGNGDWDAQNVYVQQNGFTQYLMQNQFSTCIAIDGANRKWIGTQGGGVFLMSADGTQQIYNFTAENSPLPSDNIQSISINQQTGEVFFATDHGLVSYRGTATEGNQAFNNVYAYPDPVPHGYTGPIAIKNLVTNSDVKIATVSGELVYHTVAQGGQAIWNGTNFSGVRVQTGVYVVYCTSPDGTQNIVTKLLLEN